MRTPTSFPFASPDHAALWNCIHAHLGPGEGQLDLAAILAAKFRWTRDHAERAVEEYRRFCFLAASGDEGVSPSAEVDEVWHLHLQYTRDYWERFCPQVLRMSLHHEPGGRSRTQDRRFRAQYAETLARYQAVFGAPPEAFWPSSTKRFDATPRFRTIDRERVMVLRRPRLRPAALAAGLFALLMTGLVPAAFALPANPLDWDGASFLKLYLLLCVGALVAGGVMRKLARGGGDTSTVSLTPYEAAYLAGGAPRVLDAAVADLLARGAATWEPSSNTIQITANPGRLPMPLDGIAGLLRTTPDPTRALRSVDDVLGPLRQNLQHRRLILDDDGARALARSGSMPALLVAAFGAAKIAIGVMRDRPVGFLMVLAGVMLVAGLLFRRVGSRMTGAGKKTLLRTRIDHAAATRAPRPQDMAIAVALIGTSVLAGTALAAYHTHRVPPDSGGSDGGSSGSDSGGGGGDSGGDGGGSSGCGGCGGGGGGD